MWNYLRTLRWSAWLGWQIESNWADLRLFLLYLVIKPVFGSLMLVCMFYAVQFATSGRVPIEYLPYVYVSNACYGLVGAVMFGMSSVVLRDRETYRMLKYIYISPARFQAYFAGRGIATAIEGIIGAVITIRVGLALPGIRNALPAGGPDWGWLILFVGLGCVLLWICGMMLASAALNLPRSSMFIGDGIASLVYFLSGVIFPITVLPYWLQPVSLSLPTTYWLEGMRRSIIGPVSPDSRLADSPLAQWSNLELFGILLVTTIVFGVISQFWYRYNIRKAWQLGKLEETTGV